MDASSAQHGGVRGAKLAEESAITVLGGAEANVIRV